ncbi:MAG: tRNA pseudouridine(38-40) synthase TruA [Planctomycetota bacterium]
MRHLRLVVSYDGENYVGWQVQPNGMSVQQRLEEAWFATTQETIRIVASGRTDSGVHALGQVCSVATVSSHPTNTLLRALNAHTPDDISIIQVDRAPDGFHAIRDATEKTYRYQIQFGRIRNPLKRRDHWFCHYELNIEAMRSAATYLVGELDFASFEAVGAKRNTTIRNMSRLECNMITEQSFQYLHIELTSNGFLYNMVRNIVGTLVKVGQGTRTPDWVQEVLLAKDRSVAGPTAPAHGLVLVEVEYDGIQFEG